jgi:FtsH-binding integral membrane protein
MIKSLACIFVGLLASWLTLGLVADGLGSVAAAACSSEFTLPAISCRIASLGATLLLVPLAGVLAYGAARRLLKVHRS